MRVLTALKKKKITCPISTLNWGIWKKNKVRSFRSSSPQSFPFAPSVYLVSGFSRILLVGELRTPWPQTYKWKQKILVWYGCWKEWKELQKSMYWSDNVCILKEFLFLALSAKIMLNHIKLPLIVVKTKWLNIGHFMWFQTMQRKILFDTKLWVCQVYFCLGLVLECSLLLFSTSWRLKLTCWVKSHSPVHLLCKELISSCLRMLRAHHHREPHLSLVFLWKRERSFPDPRKVSINSQHPSSDFWNSEHLDPLN